jgi:tetratricopeptide (TPR) repeat protein
VYREAGRLREANEQLTRAEEVGFDPALPFEIGRTMLAAGRPDLAEPLFQNPAEAEPYEPENWLWLARAQAELGLHAQAVETIRAGLSKVDTSGQFAPAAEKLPETAAVRAVEIKRSERAPMLGVMAESLIRLGRAGEALPALDEAIAAAPKDNWLAAVRAEAQAATSGAPVNLALNSTFDRDGVWALRTADWQLRPTKATLLNDVPAFSDGTARITQSAAGGRTLVQEILELEPGQLYRLSARVRAEGLGAGSMQVALASLRTGREVTQRVSAGDAAGWVTVSLEMAAGTGEDNNLTIVVGFAPDAPAGAVLQVDDVTLVPAATSRAERLPARTGG